MAVTGHMNFFKVNSCGLYKLNDSKAKGCELEETLDLIANWVGNAKNFSHTIPWRSSPTNTRTKCYCKDIYKDEDTGDYFVVLWKSDADSAGTLLGAAENSELGSGGVIKYTNKHKGEKVVWGRPCYYWVIPSINTVVSIKFDHSVCDSAMFQDYIKSAITNCVKHSNKKKTFTESGLVRLSFSGDKDEYAYRYSFDMSLRSLNTSSAQLAELAKSVTHIIQRESINLGVKDKRGDWLKLMNKLIPNASVNKKSKSRQIEIKAEAAPTPEEVKDIIEKHAQENRSKTSWDNVGFIVSGGKTVWVDKYRLHESITVNLSDEWFLAVDLYNKLKDKRSEILKPLLRDKEARKLA